MEVSSVAFSNSNVEVACADSQADWIRVAEAVWVFCAHNEDVLANFDSGDRSGIGLSSYMVAAF